MSLPSEEQWRPVPGYEDRYEVSNRGRVRSFAKTALAGRILTAQGDRKGYLRIRLYRAGSVRRVMVHVLVAAAFIGPRPAGLVVRHLDGNPLNNTTPNLAYGTQSDNEQDKLRHGNNRNASKTHCVNGHSLTDPENVRIRRSGRRRGRACRACGIERNRRLRSERERNPEEAAAYRAMRAAQERDRQARLRAARLEAAKLGQETA